MLFHPLIPFESDYTYNRFIVNHNNDNLVTIPLMLFQLSGKEYYAVSNITKETGILFRNILLAPEIRSKCPAKHPAILLRGCN